MTSQISFRIVVVIRPWEEHCTCCKADVVCPFNSHLELWLWTRPRQTLDLHLQAIWYRVIMRRSFRTVVLSKILWTVLHLQDKTDMWPFKDQLELWPWIRPREKLCTRAIMMAPFGSPTVIWTVSLNNWDIVKRSGCKVNLLLCGRFVGFQKQCKVMTLNKSSWAFWNSLQIRYDRCVELLEPCRKTVFLSPQDSVNSYWYTANLILDVVDFRTAATFAFITLNNILRPILNLHLFCNSCLELFFFFFFYKRL